MIPDWLKLAILVLGLAITLVAVAAPGAPPYEQRIYRELQALDGQLVHKPLPPFQINTLTGEVIDLSKLKGKIIFLNVWASWCKPCRDELPSMVRLAQALAPEHDAFEMIAVSWDNDPDELARFLSQIPQVPSNMTIGYDPDGELTKQLGTRLLPETYIIDGDGMIIARFQNLRKWDDPHAVRLLTAIIRGYRAKM